MRGLCCSQSFVFHTHILLFQGEPFMESLFNNKPLLYSLAVSGSAIVALASGVVPELCEQFELVPLPTEVS